MKKLINGIIEFHKNIRPGYRETFAQLALGQSPDSLFIACSDSRVVPNLFASTDPGNLFVVRNVGNMIPACQGAHGLSIADESEAAAIEFATMQLHVADIIICGHSECGAMQALINGRENVPYPNLKAWLQHGEKALETLKKNLDPSRGQPRGLGSSGKEPSVKMPSHNDMIQFDDTLEPHNILSQLNVLQQIEHLKSYPIIQKKLEEKTLRLHAWWFDLKSASVFWYIPHLKKFIVIDEKNADKLLPIFPEN